MTTDQFRSDTPARAPLEAWWMVVVLLLLYILAILDRLIISLLVEPIKLDLGLSDFEMSLLLGPAFGLFYAIFGFPLAWAADRYPRRVVISLGVTLWSFCTMLCGVANSFVALFSARMAVGIGEAALSPAAYSLISDKFPKRQLTRALAVYTLGPRLGSAIGFALGAVVIAFAESLGVVSLPLVGETKPWQLVFIMVGAPGLLLALLLFTFREPPRARATSATVESDSLIRFALENRKVVGLLLLGFAAVSLAGGADTWIPAYMSREFGWTPVQYAPVLSIIGFISAGSALVKSSIIDWLYGRGIHDIHLRFYTWLLLPAILITPLAFFAGNAWIFLVLYGVIQVITMGFLIYMGAIITFITPVRLRSRMVALFLFCTTIGVSIGPLIVAALTDFVLGDPLKIGISLAIVLTVTPAIALVAFRLALKGLAPHLAKAHAGG